MTTQDRVIAYLRRRGFDQFTALGIWETHIAPALACGVRAFIGKGYRFTLEQKG